MGGIEYKNSIPHYLRSRKIHMSHLAEDSGYEIAISSGILKEEIFKEFIDLKKQ